MHLIAAVRIDHQQDLRGGARRKRRIGFPHLGGPADQLADRGRAVHAAPDVEKPEGETVGQSHSEFAFQTGDILVFIFPPVPDSAGKSDEFGHFQIGAARDSVALEQKIDISSPEHFGHADVAGVSADLRRTVAGRTEHKIRWSRIQHPLTVEMSEYAAVADVGIEHADLRLRTDPFARLRNEFDHQIRSQTVHIPVPLHFGDLLLRIIHIRMAVRRLIADQRHFEVRQPVLFAPVLEMKIFQNGRLPVLAFDPFEGPSACDHITRDPTAPAGFSITEECVQIPQSQLLPLLVKGAVAHLVKRIHGKSAGEPERRIQVHGHKKTGGRMMGKHVFHLRVKNPEIIHRIPFPDQRIVGICISDRIDRIHRRNADPFDSGVAHEFQRFPLLMQKFSVWQTIRQKRTQHFFDHCFSLS